MVDPAVVWPEAGKNMFVHVYSLEGAGCGFIRARYPGPEGPSLRSHKSK